MVDQEKTWHFDDYSWLDKYDERMRGLERLRYDETLSEVVRISGAEEGDWVLDIGTGTGNLAVEFLTKGCQVIGLDPSVKLLRMAEKKIEEWGKRFEIRVCENPFLEIPFFDDTFDIVASTYSIHHLADNAKRLAIAEMKRVMRPDGKIVIGDVMFQDESDKARALAEYKDMEDEYQSILDTLLSMFSDEDFAVETEQIADTVWIVIAELG